MKKLIVWGMVAVVLLLTGAMSAYAQEPDPRLAGVWKRHVEGPGNFVWDEFIRVDIDGSQVFVNMKRIGSDDDGKPFQNYRDTKDVTTNSDGSVSFIVSISEKSYDNEDHLYWTVWESYTIRVEGGRLKVTERLKGYGANSQGRIIKDDRDDRAGVHTWQHTYFNINDNW